MKAHPMTDRIPKTPPVIRPVPDQTIRPLWSVMIPCYNCSPFLIEALRAVLQQDPGPGIMQIEVVDDCSTDTNVEALVDYIGKGRVGYYRQPENVGSLRNFETCLNRSTGKYIHLLHGDDLVLPGFYQEVEQLFTQFPEAGAAFTGYVYINEQNTELYPNTGLLSEPGILKNWLLEIGHTQHIQPPAMVVKREVYEKLGGFFAVHYGEDWEMWVRIAAHYPVAHSPKRLALYRVHENNITSRYFLSGQSITDTLTVIDIIQQYFPRSQKKRMNRLARKHFSRYFSFTADKIYHEYHRPDIALIQARRALDIHVSHTTLFYFMKIYFKILIGYKLERERKWSFRPLNLFR
jgi:glycosyltransferase involved in cell wall biosynthesis